MRGEITSGWMSWICRTCLLYSSVIVLNSVRQDITLGYNKLRAQRKSRDSIGVSFHTKGGAGWFTHCFSGPVLLESIQVFNVSAKSSCSLSITPCCCTPGRSEALKQISIKSQRASRIWTLTWFTVEWRARTTCHYLERTGTWPAWEHTLPPASPDCAACGEIWAEVPAGAAESPLQNTECEQRSMIWRR